MLRLFEVLTPLRTKKHYVQAAAFISYSAILDDSNLDECVVLTSVGERLRFDLSWNPIVIVSEATVNNKDQLPFFISPGPGRLNHSGQQRRLVSVFTCAASRLFATQDGAYRNLGFTYTHSGSACLDLYFDTTPGIDRANLERSLTLSWNEVCGLLFQPLCLLCPDL